MAFKVAVRGIPNFSYIQFETFESFAEVYASYTVRIRRSVSGPMPEIFNAEGKRVLLYILPDEHTPDTVRAVCGAYMLRMRPSMTDSSRLGMSGSGTAKADEWQALDPSRFPGHAARMEEFYAESKRIAQARAEQEAKEEAEADALSQALDAAVDAKGYDEVLKTLRALGA